MTTLLLLAGLALAAPPPREDPLAVAGMLVRDGHWDRAAAVLDKIDPASVADQGRLYALRGVVALRAQAWADAEAALTLALTAPRPKGATPEPVTWVYLAHACLELGQVDRARKLLAEAPPEARDLPAWWLATARGAHLAHDPDAAWAALDQGATRFPDQADFGRQQVLLLADQGLYHEAATRGQALLDRPDTTVKDVLVVAETLRRAGALHDADLVLTRGRMQYPDEVDLWVRAAVVALEAEQPAAAGGFLQVATELDPSRAYDAAEAWRQAGEPDRALYLNSLVVDPAPKARQRLALALDAEAWDLALSLEERAERLGLLDDGAIAYGLAYARFQVRDYDGAEALLQGITDPQGFQAATALRAAMATCREEPAACP